MKQNNLPEKDNLFNLNREEYNMQKSQRESPDPGEHETGEKISKTEIKNAHASGIGALGRSEENQLENLSNNEAGKDDDVY